MPTITASIQELQTTPVNRIKRDSVNWSDLIKHTLRVQFPRTGATALELITYFKEQNIGIADKTVRVNLLILSGLYNHTKAKPRDDLKVKYLKKDGLYKAGHKAGEPVPRFYYNNSGTQRSKGGVRKVYHTNNTTITMTKLSLITGNNLSWYGF